MSRRPRLRSIGLVAALAMVALVFVATLGRASPAPTLPQVQPDALIASVLQAMEADIPVSGHVSAHIDIGLPSLPNIAGGNGASDPISAFTGDHRLRVWSSADGYRVSDLLPLGERSIFVSRTDAWAWDSSTYTAYHLGPYPPSNPQRGEAPLLGDPLALARLALEALDPTTSVSVSGTARVAGRPVYVLSVEPRTSATLIGRIAISIDAAKRVPLRVAVYARGARSAAIWAAFTSVSFGSIDPSVYSFSPPRGAKIEQVRAESSSSPSGDESHEYSLGPDGPLRVFGHDWTTVIAVKTPPIATLPSGPGGLDLASLLPFSGPLFSVRAVDRGDHAWIVIGAVPQASLEAVAPELP